MRLKLDAGAPTPSEDAVFIAGNPIANANAIPFGGNVEGRGQFGGVIWRNTFQPPRAVFAEEIEAVSGSDRIVQAFDYFDTTAQGYWVGAAARVYRMGETIELIRETTVAAHASSFWVQWRRFVGTTCVRDFAPYSRPDATQWIAVRAYDAAGNVGPLSNVVTVTTPETWSATGATSTADSNKTLTGNETGALGAAVISVAEGWPTNRGVTITIDTAASGSVEGYALYISDHDPANHLGSYIDLTPGGAAVQVGDMLVLDHLVETPTRAHRTNRVWTANRQGPEPRTSGLGYPGAPGKTWRYKQHAGGGYGGVRSRYVELTMDAGQSHLFEAFAFTGAGDSVTDLDFYPVLQPGVTYRVQAWLRSDAPRTINPRINHSSLQTITITAINDVPVNISHLGNVAPSPAIAWNLTTTWQLFSFEFEVVAEYEGSALGKFEMLLEGPARFDLSDLDIYEAGAPPNRLSPKELAFYQSMNLRFIRDHRIVKTGGFVEGAYDARELIVDWLHDSLSNCVAAGIPEIWIQPEFYLSDADALGLVEYLFAPDGTGEWTALRSALGRTGPWVDAFDRILWELSNETWNGLASFMQFPGGSAEWYGKFQERFIQRAKASPHWTAAAEQKVEFVIGGRAALNNSYGETAIQYSPSSDWVTYAPYLGGWESGNILGAETPKTYSEFLFFAATYSITRTDTWRDRLAPAETALGRSIRIGAYENGPGFALPAGQDQTPFDRTAKSKTAGVGLFDKYMAEIRDGFELQAYFRTERGNLWSSHSFETRGSVLFPDWAWCDLFNRECAGAMHQTFRLKCTTRPITFIEIDYPAADEVGCYVTSNGTRRTVILTNRNLPWQEIDSGDALYQDGSKGASDDGARTARVKLPWASATSVTRYTMDGDYDSQNFDPAAPTYADLAITATPLGGHTGDLVVTLPSATAEVYVFDGVTT